MESAKLISVEVNNELEETILKLATKGKGLLAADESTPTIGKRFMPLNIPNTEENRKNYREMLLTTTGIEEYISGVILFEETLEQKTGKGQSFPELLNQKGIVPGIKVDKGLVFLPGTDNENTTQGLDGLSDRLIQYKNKGARFAKWRAVYQISHHTPSWQLIATNAEVLARYAAICQSVGIVPIVEPEVLIDGNHTLETSYQVSENVLHAVFKALFQHKVALEYMLLKPSMVIPGKESETKNKIQPEQVAKATLDVLLRTVPAAVPSINFLSGGQTPEQATMHLNAMHQANAKGIRDNLPWNLSFSYARALQEPSLKAWSGKSENIASAQKAFYHRAKLNSLAAEGKYINTLEKEI